MLLRVVLVGRPNVGKTLLLINFAAYLGATEITREGPNSARISLEQARRECVSYVAHKHLAALTAGLTSSKFPHRGMILVDTPGIVDGVAEEAAVRQAIGRGLEELLRAQAILVVVTRELDDLASLDDALVELASRVAPTIIVDNKADMHPTNLGVRRQHFADHPVLPLSAVTRRGFRELKQRLFAVWETEE